MKRKLVAVLLVGALLLTGCSGQSDSNNTDSDNTGSGSSSSTNSEATDSSESTEIIVDDVFSNRDYKTEYEKNCAYITLNGASATCSSNAVEINGSTITILDEGTYVVSGTLDNGMLVVASEDSDKTQVVLKGVSIHNDNGAAIYVKEADKVFLTLEAGTENTLSGGSSFEAIDDEAIDGVIYSKSDLTINGTGSLSVTSPGGHGIVSKDDLIITGGVISVDAATHGLAANDMLGIAEGNISIVSGEDSVHCDLNIYIKGGSFDINATDDAIHADENLLVDGGTINVANSYEGLEALDITIAGGDIQIVASDDGLNAAGGTDSSGFGGAGNDQFGGQRPGSGRRGGMGGMGSSSNGSIVISGGTLYIKASGDGIDANGTVEITGGYITVCGPTQGDTATLDYDTSCVITGGTFIGTGARNMAQTFSDSEQGVIAVSVGSQAAGTKITLTDSDGNVVLTHEPELSFAIVILSSPDIEKGETYTITVGTASGDFEAE